MLGIKGFKHKDKLEAKKELAIRLGATVSIFCTKYKIVLMLNLHLQPKKKRGVNIKKHMENVREQKLKEAQEKEERAQMGHLEMRKGGGGKWRYCNLLLLIFPCNLINSFITQL